MKSKLFAVFGLAVGLLAVAAPMFAHHSTVMFDEEKKITLEGTVTRMQWANPHAVMYLDVQDENGEVQNWKLELNSPVVLNRRFGWTRNTFKTGDRVRVIGSPRRDGGYGMGYASEDKFEKLPAE